MRWFVSSICLLGGCSALGEPAGPLTSTSASSAADGGREGAPGSTSGMGGDSVAGLPCEVALLLSSHCTTCHGSPLAGGAPMPLLSMEDVSVPSARNPAESYAKRSLARLRDPSAPMPPSGGGPTDAEVQAFADWVEKGMPRGSCDEIESTGDTPVTCTTDRFWEEGNRNSERMHPGFACIDCHTRGAVDEDGEIEEGPRFAVAGTVYATAHEPDDCNGVDGRGAKPVTIEVTDATGRVVRTQANAVGNFFYEDRLILPIKARVLYDGRERVMQTAQSSGDCNGCHTESGRSGAPGRIMLP